MRIIVLLFLSLLSLQAGAQKLKVGNVAIEKDPNTGSYQAMGVVTVDTVSSALLYKKALEWVTLNYKSAADVIQLQSMDDKKIILKGNFRINMFMKEGWIRHTLTLAFKDGRYRYQYSNFSYYSAGSGDIPFESNMVAKKKILSMTENKMAESVNSLTDYLTKQIDQW